MDLPSFTFTHTHTHTHTSLKHSINLGSGFTKLLTKINEGGLVGLFSVL